MTIAWAYGDSSVKGGKGVDLPENFHMIFFSSCSAQIFPTVLPEFGRAVAPPPPLRPVATGGEGGSAPPGKI